MQEYAWFPPRLENIRSGDEMMVGERLKTCIFLLGLLAELGWRPTGCAFLNQSCACWCCARISPLASFLRVRRSRPFSLFLTKGIDVSRPHRGRQRWFPKGGIPSTEFEIP